MGSRKLPATSLQNLSIRASANAPLTPVVPSHRWASSWIKVNERAALASWSLMMMNGAILSAIAKPRNTVSLIAGLHLDQYRANYRTTLVGTPANPYPVTTLKAPSFLFDPRASLVWEPDETQTYYVSWGKAATPIGTSVVGSTSPMIGL